MSYLTSPARLSYKEIGAVLGFALFLAIPLELYLGGITEPYPAILLPAGAGSIDVQANRLTFSKWQLEAVLADSSIHEVDPKAVFEPIPIQYWTYLAEEGFGMALQHKSMAIINDTTSANSAKQDAARRWLREGINKAGYPDAIAIRAIKSKLVIDLSSDSTLSQQTLHEFTIRLAR